MGPIVAGIDVGSPRKGFHAVALKGRAFLGRFHSAHADHVAAWCRELGVHVVAIDAPCKWSRTGRARQAERDLMNEKIWCFATPTRNAALAHKAAQYNWMLAGEALYLALASSHRLFDGVEHGNGRPIVFETFPHAIACHLKGQILRAKDKRRDRLQLLSREGVDTKEMTNIDWIDAGLCALAAAFFAAGEEQRYGDPHEGFIIVPPWRRNSG